MAPVTMIPGGNHRGRCRSHRSLFYEDDRVSVTHSEEVFDLRVTLRLSLGLSVIIRRRQYVQSVIVGTIPTMVRSRITIESFSIRVA